MVALYSEDELAIANTAISTLAYSRPQLIESLPAGTRVTQVSAGSKHSLFLNDKGEVFFNKEKITPAQLSLKLQTYKTQAKDPKCVINADAGADFKHVVVVLDEVRKIGIAKVGINTDKK